MKNAPRTTTRKSASPWAPVSRLEMQTLAGPELLVLGLLRSYTRKHQRSPVVSVTVSHRKIVKESRLSLSTMQRALRTLEEKGFLLRQASETKGKTNTYRLHCGISSDGDTRLTSQEECVQDDHSQDGHSQEECVQDDHTSMFKMNTGCVQDDVPADNQTTKVEKTRSSSSFSSPPKVGEETAYAAAADPAGYAGSAAAAAKSGFGFRDDREYPQRTHTPEEIEILRGELDRELGRGNYIWKSETDEDYGSVRTQILFEREGRKAALGIRIALLPESHRVTLIGEAYKGLYWNLEFVIGEASKVADELKRPFTPWDYLVAIESRLWGWRDEEIKNPVGWARRVVSGDLISGDHEACWEVTGFARPKKRKKKPEKAPKAAESRILSPAELDALAAPSVALAQRGPARESHTIGPAGSMEMGHILDSLLEA